MITKNFSRSLIIICLVLGLTSCKHGIESKQATQLTYDHKYKVDDILTSNDPNTDDSFMEYEISKAELENNKNTYTVNGTDEDGNIVNGTLNIDGKVGIGLISGAQAKGIEIVAEWVSRNSLIGTDVKGYEYQLQIDPKQY